MPKIWGLHNYSDVNRLESWRTRDSREGARRPGVADRDRRAREIRTGFPNNHGSGLTRAAKVLKYMFALAGALPQIKRLYIYRLDGGTASTRFDAGLTNAKEQPRAGYVVVCQAAARGEMQREDRQELTCSAGRAAGAALCVVRARAPLRARCAAATSRPARAARRRRRRATSVFSG